MAVLIHQSENKRGALWQGGILDLRDMGTYDVVVLCANELQPDNSEPPQDYYNRNNRKVRIICAPNDDSEGNPLTKEQAQVAVKAAIETAAEYKLGRSILVCCAQGRNRSGLVMGLVLHYIFDVSGNEAVRIIRSRIPNALMNKDFVEFLSGIRGRSLR